MEPLTWLAAVAAGTAAGVATGLLPGLHVNTLAAALLVAAPALGAAGAVALVAVATVHAFVGILPSTYLGAPGEDQALAVLPAHRMLLEGRGPEAVRVAAGASLAAMLAAVALLLPYKWLLAEPGRLLGHLDAAATWVVGGTLALLAAQEARRGPRALAWACAVLAASGLLGTLSWRLPVGGLLPAAATPLLPLLSGLFGAAGLVASLRASSPVPDQDPPAPLRGGAARRSHAGVGLGIAAAAATAAMPGLTSAVATAIARCGCRDDDPRPVLSTLCAVNTAHAVFAFAMLWVASRSRTGLTLALEALLPVRPWQRGAPPEALLDVLLAALAAAALGYAATLALDGAFARAAPRIPPRLLNGGALLLLTLLVALLTGAVGLTLFAASTVLGLVPLAAGVRRVHLTGALLVPVLALRLGWLA